MNNECHIVTGETSKCTVLSWNAQYVCGTNVLGYIVTVAPNVGNHFPTKVSSKTNEKETVFASGNSFFFFIYTKYITLFTLDTHKLHKTHYSHRAQHMKHTRHMRDFLVKIYRIYTHNKRNSRQTHDKIILITDLRHNLSDKTDHFTRNSNFLLYNSDLYSSITMRVLSFTWKL